MRLPSISKLLNLGQAAINLHLTGPLDTHGDFSILTTAAFDGLDGVEVITTSIGNYVRAGYQWRAR
jgi:hypothetical protein